MDIKMILTRLNHRIFFKKHHLPFMTEIYPGSSKVCVETSSEQRHGGAPQSLTSMVLSVSQAVPGARDGPGDHRRDAPNASTSTVGMSLATRTEELSANL